MSVGAKRAMNDQESQQPSAEPSTDPRAERQRDRGRRRQRPLAKHLEASINMDELRELIGLINENALTDFELEREGFHVKIGRNLYPRNQPFLPFRRSRNITRFRRDTQRRARCAARRSAPSGSAGRRGCLRRSRPAHHNFSDRRDFLSLASPRPKTLCASAATSNPRP